MDKLKKAVKLMDAQNDWMREAAKTMNIPFDSLQNMYTKETTKEPCLGRNAVFTPKMEEELADTIKKMANIL